MARDQSEDDFKERCVQHSMQLQEIETADIRSKLYPTRRESDGIQNRIRGFKLCSSDIHCDQDYDKHAQTKKYRSLSLN